MFSLTTSSRRALVEPVEVGTRVHLTHDRFPNVDERDSHDEGWDVYWLSPMKDWLEETR